MVEWRNAAQNTGLVHSVMKVDRSTAVKTRGSFFPMGIPVYTFIPTTSHVVVLFPFHSHGHLYLEMHPLRTKM